MRIALTREVPSSIAECELTHLERAPIDVVRARRQHDDYRRLLCDLGWSVLHLPEAAAHPDSVFVEDTAVVLPTIAVITRPGAESRRPEVIEIEAMLARFGATARLERPAMLDGGDVMVVGSRVFVGLSTRTNDAAIEQLRGVLRPHGHTVHGVAVEACLHLKSAVTAVDAETVLVQPDWIDPGAFEGLRVLRADPDEPGAANVLDLGDTKVVAAAFPRTREALEAAGYRCASVEADELAKAEGALTCCSLLLEA